MGLYDDYYYLYVAQGDVPADEPAADDSGDDGRPYVLDNTGWVHILHLVLSFLLDVLRIFNA